MVRKGQFVGLDWNRIARLHSQVMTNTCEIFSQPFFFSQIPFPVVCDLPSQL